MFVGGCEIYLEFLLNPVTASAVEKSHLIVSHLLVDPQMFPDGGCIEGSHHPRISTLAAGAHGAVECDGVDHVVVVGGELVSVFHHHVLHHLLDGVGVGEAGGVHLQARLALEHLHPVMLLDVADCLSLDNVVSTIVTSLGWSRQEGVRSVELLMVLLDVMNPFYL